MSTVVESVPLTPLPPSKIKQCDTLTRRYSLPLIFGIFIGLIHINISLSSYYYIFNTPIIPNYKLFNQYPITLKFLINDWFMIYFFGFTFKFIIDALIPPHGHMYPLKKTISPIFSSLCGIVTPILLYTLSVSIITQLSSEYAIDTVLNGWAIPMSTDIALSWTVATFVFNNHLVTDTSTGANHSIHPCISFLLLLAMTDDIIGLIVIGIVYAEKNDIEFNPIWLILIVIIIIISAISNKIFKIYRWWYYVFIIGSVSWISFLLSGVHPALSLIPIMPTMIIKKTMQNRSRQHVRYNNISCINDESEFESDNCDDVLALNNNNNDDSVSDDESETTPIPPINNEYSLEMLNKFEKNIDIFVEYGLFFFTYCNAGVKFNNFGNITLCIFLSLLFGKIIGISVGSFIVNKLFEIPFPSGMKLKHLPLIGFCASLSLTVSLFISNIAFIDENLKEEAKMGLIVAALFGMVGGIIYRMMYKSNNLISTHDVGGSTK